jgi:hypothetical protein
LRRKVPSAKRRRPQRASPGASPRGWLEMSLPAPSTSTSDVGVLPCGPSATRYEKTPSPTEASPRQLEPVWVTGLPTSAPVGSSARKRQSYSSTARAPTPVALAATAMVPLAWDVTPSDV